MGKRKITAKNSVTSKRKVVDFHMNFQDTKEIFEEEVKKLG